MARPLCTAAVLSLCAILVPTGCDSPLSPPAVAPNAAITPDGTVITTVKDVVPIEAVVSGECLNDFELFAISGELGVVHRLTLTPTSGGKTYLLNLDTHVWSQGIRGVGQTLGQEWSAVGGEEIAVTEEEWTTGPQEGFRESFVLDPAPALDAEGGAQQRAAAFQLRFVAELQIGDDFGITTTVEDVQLVCPPSDADDGTIIVTKQDKLDVDTEVTTPCFNDGVEEKVAISGVLGVVNHVKLTPTGGQTYAMDLSTVVWSEGIQAVGLASAAKAVGVGADRNQVTREVTLPFGESSWGVVDFLDTNGDRFPDVISSGGVFFFDVQIAEDFSISTTLVDIQILCPPPPVVDN